MKLPGYVYRHPVVLKQAAGQLNGAGEAILMPPRTIKVMWMDRFTMLRTKKSEQQSSTTLIYSPIEMKKGDVLVRGGREHIILEVKQIDDLTTGKPIYWEVRA